MGETLATQSVLHTGRPAAMHLRAPAALLEYAGEEMARYGLAVIFLWFGAMKFTDYEAAGIAPFVMNSPLVGWWHSLLGIKGTSLMLGIYEIATGLLLLARPFSSLLPAIGAGMGVITFVITMSFFLTTPGVAEAKAGGFPAISAPVGQFLLKDLGLLGLCVWILGRSLARSRA